MVRNGKGRLKLGGLTWWQKLTRDGPERYEIPPYGKISISQVGWDWPWIRCWLTRQFREDWLIRIPRHLGLAWYDFDRDVSLYVVYPLNFVLAFLRHMYLKLAWEIPYVWKERQREWYAKRKAARTPR